MQNYITNLESEDRLHLVDTRTSAVTIPSNQQPKRSGEADLPSDELKRLADFFSILMAIDKREKVTKMHEKQTQ